MKLNQFWSAALATSTFSMITLVAQDAKAMALFTLDFTDTNLFSRGITSPGDINNIDLDVVTVDVRGRTRGSNQARDLSFTRNGVGIVGNGSNTINGSQVSDDPNTNVNEARANDERFRLDFSKQVKFTEIVFGNNNGSDDYTLRIDGSTFGSPNTDIPLSGVLSLNTIFGTRFDIEARQSNDNFRITSISGEVIPTPALLPGLLGLGTAALRRRREEITDA